MKEVVWPPTSVVEAVPQLCGAVDDGKRRIPPISPKPDFPVSDCGVYFLTLRNRLKLQAHGLFWFVDSDVTISNPLHPSPTFPSAIF